MLEPPVSSLRWEMLREGVEDYEFLHLLRDLLSRRREGLDSLTVKRIEALLNVPQTITSRHDDFHDRPRPDLRPPGRDRPGNRGTGSVIGLSRVFQEKLPPFLTGKECSSRNDVMAGSVWVHGLAW